MIKLNKSVFLIAILLIGTIGFASCDSAPTTTNSGNNAVVNKPAANTTTDVTKTEMPMGDKIGVAECDEYIEKYEACINSKVPEAQRATFRSSFEAARKSWKDAAANPQAKAGLANGCKLALETAKQTMTTYSCAW